MTSSDHHLQRRTSHALPSQALKTTASASSSPSTKSQRLQTSRQIYGKNIKNLAQRARQRHERREDIFLKPQPSPKSAALFSAASAPRLPDVEDSQSPRNSTLYRRCTNNLSPFPNSASPKSAKWSFHGHKEQLPPQSEATDREEDTGEAEVPNSTTSEQNHEGLTDGRTPNIRWNLWQTISALSLNQKRLTMAGIMQEILCYAVSMYYCGMGDRVLANLDEVQEKARRTELRIINGQAQLWRAIILDEIGQTELIAELLADALFLLAAGPGAALSFAEIPPEDADFYQLWRMIWVRNYWYSLWKYLKMEDAKDNPDTPMQDLESQESKDEAQEWALHFLDRLENCFDHSKWPGFDRGRISVRFSKVNNTSFDQVRGGPLAQRIRMMTQKVHDLEAKDRENTRKIEALRNDNIRYKAEREIFNTDLSTGHTRDGIYPHNITDQSVEDESRPTSVVPSAIDKDSGSRHDPIDEHAFTEARPSAALGPDQVELLYQQLRNGEAKRTEQDRHGQLATQKSHPEVIHGYREPNSVQKQLLENFYDNVRGSHISPFNKRINLWAQDAHGGRVISGSSSRVGSPFSPNNITPSSPASGRSWRQDRSVDSVPYRSSRKSEPVELRVRNPDKPLSKTEITPSTAWQSNNVLPSPITHSTGSVATPASHPGDRDTSPVQVEGSPRTLDEELADALSLNPKPDMRVFNSIWSGTPPLAVEDLLLLQDHQDDHNHAKPIFRVPAYNSSKLPSLTTRSFRTAARSPESISPLANPEDLPLTDTPGGHQLEETLSHIRAHQEQRQRSMPDTSIIPEGLNKRMVTQENSYDNQSLAERNEQNLHERRNSAASGTKSLPSFDNQSQTLFLGDSPSEDIKNSTTASDHSQEVENVENTGSGLDGTSHASSSSAQRSRSAENSDRQIQPRRDVNIGSAKSLKLQMPQLASISEHRLMASIVPASPSPLRASFSQAAASEDPEFADAIGSSG